MTLSWQDLIEIEKTKSYFKDILAFIETERQSGKTIYPAEADQFNAFSLTPFETIKVVILGQDPYHGENQAHGLAFSVQKGVKIPPSLRNIYQELGSDIDGFIPPDHGNLEAWARQGVLLLNTVLTVEERKAHSHAKIGWEDFTDGVIDAINEYQDNIVFILWGAHAERKGKSIDRERHYVLSSAHPSPLSAYRGFLGCKHFSKTNEYLISQGKEPINWQN